MRIGRLASWTGLAAGAMLGAVVAGSALAAPAPTVVAIDFPTAQVGYALVQSGPGLTATLYGTTNGGSRWTSLGARMTAGPGAIGFAPGGYGTALVNPNMGAGQAAWTVDESRGGRTWTKSGTLYGSNGPLAVAYAGKSAWVLNGSFAGAWATLSGKSGGRWRTAHTFEVPAAQRKAAFSPSAVGLSFSAATGIAVVAYQPVAQGGTSPLYAYRSTDAGKTWSPVAVASHGLRGVIRAVSFAATGAGVVAVAPMGSQTFTLYATSDGGARWTKSFTAENSASVILDMVTGKVGYADVTSTSGPNGAHGHSQILRTADGGRSWHVVTTP